MKKESMREVGIPSESPDGALDDVPTDFDVEPQSEPATSSTSPNRVPARDRPWTKSSFWLLQFIILALYLARVAATVAFHFDTTSLALQLSTFAIFLVPVVYASLNYGLDGALVTSGWITLLALPRFISEVHSRNFVTAWAELVQVVLLDALAILVGQRVSAERDARRLAESAQEAHLRAEALYRDLFESNQAPILLVDGNGNVTEANASAQRAFGGLIKRRNDLEAPPQSGDPVRLVDMIGPDAARLVLARLLTRPHPEVNENEGLTAESELVEPVSFEIDGQSTLFRPTATTLGHSDDGARMQVIFEDVTRETRRHDLMEAYAARVVLGQEEERRHIAQELHDGPVQALIHLCRQIDSVEPLADPANDRGSQLSELRVIVEDTVKELRSIAKGLRPSVLDDLGLVASISQTLSEAADRRQFETTFGVTGQERRLPSPVELALFRIAQEAISNIERHAVARRVAVGLNFEEGGLRLLVRDDGVGFELPRRPEGGNSESLGIPGMTERANLIGSRLVIHTDPGAGTTVDVWVPATILARN
jgi:signal transduction histidine kinase